MIEIVGTRIERQFGHQIGVEPGPGEQVAVGLSQDRQGLIDQRRIAAHSNSHPIDVEGDRPDRFVGPDGSILPVPSSDCHGTIADIVIQPRNGSATIRSESSHGGPFSEDRLKNPADTAAAASRSRSVLVKEQVTMVIAIARREVDQGQLDHRAGLAHVAERATLLFELEQPLLEPCGDDLRHAINAPLDRIRPPARAG